jgi:hypothetical protein
MTKVGFVNETATAGVPNIFPSGSLLGEKRKRRINDDGGNDWL